MRAGWILLKIRHKQYGVNVDDVGHDAHIVPPYSFVNAFGQSPLRLRRSPLCKGGLDFVTFQPPL